MKCDICKAKVEYTFLKKPLGTYIGSGKNKKFVCTKCQKTNSQEEIIKKLTKYCHRGSTVEHRSRKAKVEGSNPFGGLLIIKE